ncbi:MAG TPA: hypothetical protein VMZ53_17190 [Kofleriaceae bacterium]|nr:hypothetical protein [Kofleriaceae bacterium]
MKRSPRAALLLVAGGVGLFVILGVLVRAVHSEAPESSPEITSRSGNGSTTTQSPASGTGPFASRDSSGRKQSIWRAPGFRVGRSDDSSTASAAVADESSAAKTGDTQNLHFGGTQLRAQTKAISPWVQRCVDDAVKKGQSPSGTAMLTYVVAKHGDKYEVEDSGIDDEQTTIQNAELLDCMRTAAFAMKFEGLPRDATGIVASRKVTLEAGRLVEHKHVTFSYLH